MKKIFFIIIPTLIYNFLNVKFSLNVLNIENIHFIAKKKEYNIIISDINFYHNTYILTVDAEKDIITQKELIFKDRLDSFKKQEKYIDIYTFSRYLLIYKYGVNNTIYFNDYIGRQAFSDRNILIGIRKSTSTLFKYDIILYLIKSPYNEISDIITIEPKTEQYEYHLIGLKDCFVFIMLYNNNDRMYFKKKGDVKIKLLDFNLNVIDTMNYTYFNYTNIVVLELSENNKCNEFIICVRNHDDEITYMDCRIVKYDNAHLYFGESIRIISKKGYSNGDFYINIFDENKIGFYFVTAPYDLITIIQYENKKLSYYNNIRESPIPEHIYMNSYSRIINTYKGIAIISAMRNALYLNYLSTTCSLKTIYLYPNQLLEFPIEEFIFPGADGLEFFFSYIDEDLKIYKNATEVKIFQLFNDLSNFTYFLKIENIIKHEYFLEVRKNSVSYSCKILIDIIVETKINTYKEVHKCLMNNAFDRVNNITYSNLYNNFNIKNNKEIIQFKFEFEENVFGNDTIFYYNNYSLKCINKDRRVICRAPTSIFKRYVKLYLYSYLSCYNLINVGWFQIVDDYILGRYDLLYYNFDYISEIYDPSERITEYNEKMINYYYWFSCLSYCEEDEIELGHCCPKILRDWDIVFHKKYYIEKTLFEYFRDLLELRLESLAEDEDESVKNIVNGKNSKDLNKVVEKIKDFFENIDKIENIFTIFGVVLNGLSVTYKIYPYQYNFVILKNVKYKKIVVTFPGLTSYIQMLDELIHSDLIYLTFEIKGKIMRILRMFHDIFETIQEDLFNNLKNINGINDTEYQLIFTGHSIGGAIASISSFYLINEYKFNSENILITFGQPKVGNEIFAKYLTENLKQIYRIARPTDFETIFPFSKMDYFFKAFRIAKIVKEIFDFIVNFYTGNYITVVLTVFSWVKDKDDIVEESKNLFAFHDLKYFHIGGLYMIDDDSNNVYHCVDFLDENIEHPICKSHKFSIPLMWNFFKNRKYLSLNQEPDFYNNNCQLLKSMFPFKVVIKTFETLRRRLDIINKENTNYNRYKYIKQRKLIYIQEPQEIVELFTKIYFENNKNEFVYKFQSQENINKDYLIIIINPENDNFFGEICFSQNITWLINNEIESINCNNINTKKSIVVKILLKKEITNEKELYIYIKGKVSGNFEMCDLTKEKILDISSSYYIPLIEDFPSEKSLSFKLPKNEEDIYINILMYNYDNNNNDKNISSIFKIYKNNNIINYEKSLLILEKDNDYSFKYYPSNNELIINFIDIYSNKFLEKLLYTFDGQNFYFNYNIELINNNQTYFGLFFDINEDINVKGYLSDYIEFQDNVYNYLINTKDKFFISEKDNQFNYCNLNVYIDLGYTSNFKIYEINDVITINKLNFKYKINKWKNYVFLLDEILVKNYAKFETYTFISINNDNNYLKLILSNGEIITTKNNLFLKLYEIKGIFIKVFEDDIFEMSLIPEEVSKYINENSLTFYDFIFFENKKFSIDFYYNKEKSFMYYNSLSNNMKIYELNERSKFNLEEFINSNLTNFSPFSRLKTIEKQKTYILMKELSSSNQLLYEYYINRPFDFEFILDQSKICFLFMDFDYNFIYNKKMKMILLKILNNNNISSSMNIICGNEKVEIVEKYQVINVEKCEGEFIMSGNNSLVFFYLPLILTDSYTKIEKKDLFDLSNIKYFFFVPKKNDFNSINILLTIDYQNKEFPVYVTYYVEYGIIPYSKNIEKKSVFINDKMNIIIPNYSNDSNENEQYFIFFYFNTTLSKLNAQVTYENIINLDNQAHLILKSGKHNIILNYDNNYYFNITNSPNIKRDDNVFSIIKNGNSIETIKISDKNNSIYLEEPSYNENLLIKIENNNDILLCLSSEYFQDFNDIIYDRNINVEQNENILIVKFNTTTYNSKLEYYISLIDNDDNIDLIQFHEFIFENKYIYKNIFHSIGVDPIETNISLPNNFKYNKNYTIIILGKDTYGDSFNYYYFEPKKIFIENSNILIDTENNSDDNDNNKKSNKKLIIIIIIAVAGVILIGGVIFAIIYFCKKKKYNKIGKIIK